MKIFQTIQMNFAYIGYEANQRPFNRRQKWMLILTFLSLTSVYGHLFYVANSPKKYMDSIFITTLTALTAISRISTIFKMKSMFIFIDEVEEVLDARLKYPASKEMYEKTNRQIELVSKIVYFVMVKLTIPAAIMPRAFISYFKYFSTDLGSDAFELSIPVWYPFDWKNPFGYLIAVALQIEQSLIVLHYMACCLTYTIGAALISFAVAKDIKNSLILIDESAQSKKSRAHMMEQFIELIRFTNLRKLVYYIEDVFQITLVLLFLGCTGAICLGLLMIQIDVSHFDNNMIMVFESVFYGFWSLNLIFATCEFAQRFTDAFDGINDLIRQLHWYLYPVEIQQLLIPIIMYAQKPVCISFFGSISCSRERFRKVVYTGYSYFMVLRKVYG